MIKPSLPKQYASLATDITEDSELLFGSSICKRLEKLSKENKIKSLLDKDTNSGIKRKIEQPTSSNRWPFYKTQKRANTSNENNNNHNRKVQIYSKKHTNHNNNNNSRAVGKHQKQ